MAIRITSYRMLEEAVLKPTAKGMSSAVASAVARHLSEEIKNSIYNSKKPSVYKRTKQFLKSITIEKSIIYSGRIAQTNIVFDYKKIKPQFTGRGWNQHMGMSKQSFHEGNLVQVLEEGTIGSASLYEREGAWFLLRTKQWLENEISSNGFKVSDVTMRVSNPDISDEAPDMVPVGIRIRKRL